MFCIVSLISNFVYEPQFLKEEKQERNQDAFHLFLCQHGTESFSILEQSLVIFSTILEGDSSLFEDPAIH